MEGDAPESGRNPGQVANGLPNTWMDDESADPCAIADPPRPMTSTRDPKAPMPSRLIVAVVLGAFAVAWAVFILFVTSSTLGRVGASLIIVGGLTGIVVIALDARHRRRRDVPAAKQAPTD